MGESDAHAEKTVAAFNRLSETRGWPMRADANLAFEAATAANALAVWCERARNQCMPSRSDMTPRTMKSFLTEVALFDVVREDDRLRFRSRLVGSNVARVFGDGHGRFLDEAVPQPFLDRWQALLKLPLDTGGPVRTTSRVEFQQQTYLYVECLLAPLGEMPSAPDTIFMVVHASPANAHAGAALAAAPRVGLLAG